MTAASILDRVTWGPLVATLDPLTGTLGTILDRITGLPADTLYRPAYLALARQEMLAHWASTTDLA